MEGEGRNGKRSSRQRRSSHAKENEQARYNKRGVGSKANNERGRHSRVPAKLDHRVLHKDPPERVANRMGLIEDLEGRGGEVWCGPRELRRPFAEREEA